MALRFAIALVFGLSLLAAQAENRTGQAASNRAIPAHTSPDLSFSLSENPSMNDIRGVRFFAEPLVPVGLTPSAEENREFSIALRQYTRRALLDDFSDLEDFVAKYPDSPWTPSLTFNLGMEYYKTGWYSKALQAFSKSWSLLRPTTDPVVKPLADSSVGELAFMYARIGRMQELESLLNSIRGRVLVGPATEQIAGAKQGLWTMQHRPEIAFRCGVLALDRIIAHSTPEKAGSSFVHESRSTTNGFSLKQVAAVARQLGMNYQTAYRSSGAAMLMPAVVNWKVGHYAALIREENGLYLLQDPTFVNDTWVTHRALEAETTGYFLVPAGNLPPGWRSVSDRESATVWGKGATSNNDPNSTDCKEICAYQCLSCGGGGLGGQADDSGGNAGDGSGAGDQSANDDSGWNSGDQEMAGGDEGMAVHNIHLMLVSLHIQDSPVGYRPPVGPGVRFRAVYNQREANQPAIFSYSNLGPQWTFNWLAYISDNLSAPSADVNYYAAGGGTLPFTGFNTSSKAFAPQLKSHVILTRTSPTSYQMLFPDGSKKIFAQPDAPTNTTRHVFLTQIVDPAGNSVQLTYDANFRIIALKDAIGQVTVLSYENASDLLKITKVTDPFGRSASFLYDVQGRLFQITDCLGLTSQFSYDSGTFIQALATPYGKTRFAYGESGRDRWLEVTHPNAEKERVEFTESSTVGTPQIEPASTVPQGLATANNYLVYRNTYYWDRRAYPAYLASTNFYASARIYHWLHTLDMTSASGVLESIKLPLENRVWFNYDGQSQPIQIGTSSHPTFIGRVLDDGNTQLYQNRYNDLGHITNSIDPVGRRMTYIYASNLDDLLEVHQTTGTNNDLVARFQHNSQHRPVAVWDTAGQMTTNTYNTRGQLLTTTNPRSETTTYNYDTNGYLLAVAGPLPGTNDTVSLNYDGVGRVHSTSDTDGYTLTYGYDNADRLTNISYPDGTFTAYVYSNLDIVQTTDRMGRKTFYGHDALRQLTSIQDPLDRISYFQYCGCGSLSALVDPMGRLTSWEHDVEGRLTAKQYTDGSRITYNYENTSERLKSTIDEKGQVKAYAYNSDNTLHQITYPVAQVATPTVTFGYDPNYNRMVSMQDGIGTTSWNYYPAGILGALKVAEVDGPWPNEVVSYQYDQLRRVTSRAINGVAETYTYDGLGRVTNTINALGSFAYGYDNATPRLLNAYYPNGQSSHYNYYDNLGDRRLQRIIHQKRDSSLISRFTYTYNPVGNITNWLQELGVETNNWSISYDNANQLTAVGINPGTAIALQYNYSYDPAGNRLLENSNVLQRSFQYNSLNELVQSSDLTVTNITYEWDAENRLTAINQAANRSEFSYDGLGRRVKIIEKANGISTDEKRFIFTGATILQERMNDNFVTREFFSQGVLSVNGNSYYSRDHLGSVRELTDNSSALLAEYRYEPFGAASKLLGTMDADFGFTSFYVHQPTKLNLTIFRAYHSLNARWLSRDTIGEKASRNLFLYAGNNPLNNIDPLGLASIKIKGIGPWSHTTVTIVTDDGHVSTYGFGPDYNSDGLSQIFGTVDGIIEKDKGYGRFNGILKNPDTISEETAQRIIQLLEYYRQHPPPYNLFHQNCHLLDRMTRDEINGQNGADEVEDPEQLSREPSYFGPFSGTP